MTAKLFDCVKRGFSFSFFLFFFGLSVHSCKNRNPAINLLAGKSRLCATRYGGGGALQDRGDGKSLPATKHFVWITGQKQTNKKNQRKIRAGFVLSPVRFVHLGCTVVLWYYIFQKFLKSTFRERQKLQKFKNCTWIFVMYYLV